MINDDGGPIELDKIERPFPNCSDEPSVAAMRMLFNISEWGPFVSDEALDKTLRPFFEEAAAVGICEALKDIQIEITPFGVIVYTEDDAWLERRFTWKDIIGLEAARFAPGQMDGGAEACEQIAEALERLAATYRKLAKDQAEEDCKQATRRVDG